MRLIIINLLIIRGFQLPFFTMGASLFVLFIVSYIYFPNPSIDASNNIENNAEASLPMLPLLMIPQFLLTLMMLFCGSLSINFIEPSIQLHLQPVMKKFN